MIQHNSQKSIHTQELSQWIVEASKSDSAGKQNAEVNRGATYTPGQTGHVDLVSLFAQDTPELATQNGAIEATPHRDVPLKLFPEAKRFTDAPTPTLNGDVENKRDDADRLFATPQLPKNPFGKHYSPEIGGMGLSQVFKTTQAPSSPTIARRLPVPSSDRPSPKVRVTHNNDLNLPSDITIDSISPVVNGTPRPFTAPSSSPTTSSRKGAFQRAITEPHAIYVSRKASQEKRERKRREELEANSSPIDKDGEIIDALLQDTSDIQREHKRRKVARDTKAILSAITAPPRPTTQVTSKARAIEPARKASLCPSSSAKKLEEVVLSSDETNENSTEDETEAEEENEASPIRSDGEAAEENKENRGDDNVQVPMTGFPQVKRSGYVRPSRLLSSSPSARRRQTNPPDKDDSEDELTRSPSTHPVGPLRRLEVVDGDRELVAIADSQSSQKKAYLPRQLAQRRELASSNGSSNIVPQSQTVRVPISSEKESSVVHRNVANSSQQTMSPPLSSPPKISQNSKRAAAGNHVHGGESTTDQIFSPSSSPPLMLRNSRVASRGSDLCGNVEVGNVKEISEASRPELHVQRKRRPSAVPNSSPIVHSGSLPQPEIERAPTSQKTGLSSTIPETTSHGSHEGRPAEETALASLSANNRSPQGCLTPAKSSYRKSQQSSETPNSARHVPNSVKRTPESDRPPMPKSLTSIAAKVQDNDGPDVGDLDLGIFTADVAEFREQMEQWDNSSPIGPVRKRRRGLGGRPIVLPEPSSNSKPDVSSDCPSAVPPSNSHVSTLEQEDELATGPTTSPLGTKRLSAQAGVHSQEHGPRPGERQSGLEHSPSNSKATKILGGIDRPNSSSATATNDRRSPVPARTTSINPDVERIGRTTSGEKHLHIQKVTAPTRVFAIFNGSPQGFFSATCLAPASTPDHRYKVRFDDGTITLVSVSAVKRLELREGDEVKIYRAGQRAQMYMVVGFEKAVVRNSSQGDPQYPSTDVYGNLGVRVRAVKRSGSTASIAEETVPISEIYLTTQLWRKLQDRLYTHLPNEALLSGFHTPSERSSTPSTPQSRMRFAKVASNLSTNQRAIATSKTTSHQMTDIFADIIFVMTSIAEEHRGQVQRSIADNGGVLLSDGWDEAFQTPPPELFSSTSKTANPTLPPPTAEDNAIATGTFDLNSTASTSRFALLLADTHCRTLKYLHALALGIPCIHTRWVADCVRAGNLIDWRPYVLASGQSSFLGDAICSRTLSFNPHSGGAVALQEMIGTRNKWLDNNKVLLVSGAKASAEITRAYVFIMHALGAVKVGVVNSRKEAEDVLKKKSARNDWDWVCVIEDEKADSGAAASKKRRRGPSYAKDMMGIVASPDVEALEKCTSARVVGRETIVQTLILGRFLEE